VAKELSSLQIVARVRGVFARHWMDLGLISILYSQGTVRLQGTIQKLQQAGDPVDEMLLSVIEQEIRRVKDVKRVNFNFDNWVKTSTGWEKIREKRVGAASVTVGAHSGEGSEEEEEGTEEEAAEEREETVS
jgi:hypothetical protein